MTYHSITSPGVLGDHNSQILRHGRGPRPRQCGNHAGIGAARRPGGRPDFRRGGYRNRVLIGKDTRRSGYMIETALVAGFASMGMDVLLTGPIPTPAVGMLTRSMRADLGVMISASHNPFDDNGIELFGPDGFELSDEVEQQIETAHEFQPY